MGGNVESGVCRGEFSDGRFRHTLDRGTGLVCRDGWS